MKKIKNTLYIFTDDAYLSLENENVVIKSDGKEMGRVPLLTLESISSFSYAGASPALMGACCERGIRLSFFTPKGKFLTDCRGCNNGNIFLKKAHFKASESEKEAIKIARHFILGKVFNSRTVLERAIRDHRMRIDVGAMQAVAQHLTDVIVAIKECETLDSLRGIEGDAAASYFSVFDNMILRNKEDFHFSGRSRRPPMDRTNAMLSLFYTTLTLDCSSALLGVGLDPSAGLMHADRPGRDSLSLDLMEELRPVFVDRFVITAINNRMVQKDDFEERETGEFRLSDAARKTLYQAWQEKKQETVIHPFTKEKVPRGLIPHIQAQMLAKCLRGDLDAYPPFLWK